MTSSMPINEPVVNGQGNPPVQSGVVEDFVKILSQLSSDQGCRNIINLVSEMDALREMNEKLVHEVKNGSIAVTTILAENRKVENDNQELSNRCSLKDGELKKAQIQASDADKQLQLALKNISDLKTQLGTNKDEIDKTMANQKKKETQIRDLNDRIETSLKSAKQAELDLKAAQAEREQVKKQYETASQELASFRARAPFLRNPGDPELRDHVRQLRGMFEDAHRLVHHFFDQLLLEPQITHGKSWQNFTKLGCLDKIPLPPSNSEVARQMRVAAVLRVLAETACEYIYQPVYLTEDGTEMGEVISQASPSDAQWMRRVLLNIEAKRQGDHGKRRAENAANEVVEMLGFFLINSPAETSDFKAAVKEWYQKACKVWMSLQQLEIRFEAGLEVQIGDQSPLRWKPLPDLLHKDSSPTEGAPNGSKTRSDAKDLVMGDIAAEVWPEFLATKRERLIPVLPGYVLLEAQAAVARQELEAVTLNRASGIRRAAHGRQRPVQTVMGGANGSTEDLSFLSQRG